MSLLSRLLFDGGPCPQLFRTNATSLGLPVAEIEALVLSHWHVDHSDPEFTDLALPGLQVQQHSEGHTLLGNTFFVSGFIPRVVQYETGNPSHVSQWTADGDFEEDALIVDERYVAALVKGKGIVVFSACSHAGIINVMTDVAAQSGQPPYAVFGGEWMDALMGGMILQ
eukprot:gene9822-9980_t